MNVAKLAMRQVLESTEEIIPWTSKINPALYPVYVKLIKLFFCLQFLGQPYYYLIHVPFNETRLNILGFAYGSVNFSCGAVYLVSYSDKDPSLYKYQLVSTCSELESVNVPVNDLDTVPRGKHSL